MGPKQLSVSLLLSDFDDVKNISAVFKKLGVVPHFYEDLKTFWSGTSESNPSLCIVDVKMMSEEQLVLCEHPAIKAENLPLVFFYNKNTEPLLVSTNDFFHLGLLLKTENYEGPLKIILRRLNSYLILKDENRELIFQKQKLVETIDLLKIENDTIVKTDQYQSMVKRVCLELENNREGSDFFKAVEKVFAGIDEILEFSMMELSFNGKKLLSANSHQMKFRPIPALLLEQVCNKGIPLFAQNMATSVAMEMMGGDLVALLVKGRQIFPDKIIFVKTKNELFYHNFDWNMLEAFLHGFNASFKNRLEGDLLKEKRFSSIYHVMSFLDQFLYGGNNNEYRLIDLDLSSLVELVLKKSNNRFYWDKFFKEFINKLEIESRVEFRSFEFGVGHLGFVVETSVLDSFFDELKDFSLKFSYWKYFEDGDGVLAQMVSPKVTMVPLSAFAYLKAVQNQSFLLNQNQPEININKRYMDKSLNQ